MALAFFVAFALLYLAGFYSLDTGQALAQWSKGMVKFVIHLLFLAAAVGYLAQRGQRFFWRALGWFTLGFVANALYGILQLVAARGGVNLDHVVLAPLTVDSPNATDFATDKLTVAHFTPVILANRVTLDYDHADEVDTHHYAFAVSDEEFEAAFGRILALGRTRLR